MTSRPIVVGYDGSASADAAVDWAVAEAVRTGTPVQLAYAFEWLTGAGPIIPGPADRPTAPTAARRPTAPTAARRPTAPPTARRAVGHDRPAERDHARHGRLSAARLDGG
ncbi:universal stress protein [Solwaraspora sp. WMMD406]|uniref:universal stress protein n=1 Tax=Solwaraspora sp. WMMD406 TaxID=3016095 RepID=UPI00241646DC|nr:universal stress protein [Solwaraspora sp. WMMD406]MDG4766843.1 universal stress protein [Solwaraspora sp. WMMD406]